jgi:hypothetical protein
LQPFDGGATSDCCAHHEQSAGANEKCQKHDSNRTRQDEAKGSTSRRGIGWVSGFFARKCRGEGFNELGLSNIGIAPAPPTTWVCESALVDTCQSLDQIPDSSTIRPIIPPPKC